MFKTNPSYLMDYLDICTPNDLSNFMNELPSFYFDYTEIRAYADFLNIFFARKHDKGGFVDYRKNMVDFCQ